MRKLSDYKGEDALDLLADLIDPVADIASDKEIATLVRSKQSKMAIVKVAIKNHKKAILEILAILEGVPVEEYECSVFSLPVKILEILNDKELINFFTSAGQTEDATSFGSSMENTEAEE